MGRWSNLDTDEERLAEGMTRVGYDADTQVYTYQDSNGDYYEGPAGSRYGPLTRISGSVPQMSDEEQARLVAAADAVGKVSWRREMMPLLNFFVIIGVVLLLVIWYLRR
jgi:hypothetical protein